MNNRLRVIVFVAVTSFALCNAKYLVAPGKQNSGASSTPEPQITTIKPALTCKCEETAEPICANNGVTYKNMCRFECAKHKVPRLRIVKDGECGKYLSKLQFWSFG